MDETLTYRSLLLRELRSRTAVNRAYSQRAFARDIGMAPHRLSEILRGKKGLSRERALEVAQKLKYSQADAELFGNLVEAEHGRNREARVRAKERLGHQQSQRDVLSDTHFELISRWYHLAILELCEMPTFRFNHDWIARKLGITVEEAKSATQRLLDLGLAEVIGGKLVSTKKNTHHFAEGSSHAIRDFHSGLSERGLHAIHEQSSSERFLDSLILKIDPRLIPEINAEISSCMETICRIARRGRQKTALYALSTNLFSLLKEKYENVH